MNDVDLYYKISNLPNSLKNDLMKYLDYLLMKSKHNYENEKPANKKTPKAGCMKGTFLIKDDFDEPLEDFKEYME